MSFDSKKIWIDLSKLAGGSQEKIKSIPQKKPENFPESFSTTLKDALSRVNDLQIEANRQLELMMTGDVEDISQVVIALQKADVALKLITEIRNKLLDAYQQISRMPI